MDGLYAVAEMRNMIRTLLPDYKESDLELITITAKEVSRGGQVTLEFNFGVDGSKW